MKKQKVLTISQRYKAFTLAEVLLTLMIIGVLAMTTIPSLIQAYRERVTVTRVKKIYSVLNQAFLMASNEYGSPKNANWPEDPDFNSSTEGNSYYINAGRFGYSISKYLNIKQNCKVNRNKYLGKKCWPDVDYKKLDGTTGNGIWSTGANMNTSDAYRFNTTDNMAISIMFSYLDCSYFGDICGTIYVDVNGDAPPNQFGHDFFTFYLRTNRISYNNINLCVEDARGLGCSKWIIEKSNMDYLKSWQ